MTRRRLARAVLLAAVVAASVLVVVRISRDGSGGGTSGSRASASTGTAPAGPTTLRPGALRVGVPELPPTLDPFDARSRRPAGIDVLSQVLPQLFDVDPDGRVHGRLVDDGSVRDEGTTVRFRLRAGARWSDGPAITADDLRFTLGVVRSGRWPGPAAGYDQLSGIDGAGGEVTLRFSQPYPQWRRLFSGSDFLLPRHRLAGADLGSVWAGGPDVSGGPFRLAGFTPGLDVVLSANPAWWGGAPRAGSLRLLVAPDTDTLQRLLEQGDLDVAWMPAFTERTRTVQGIGGTTVSIASPGGRLVEVVVNTATLGLGPRAALLGLVDRDRFVDVLLRGEASTAASWDPALRGAGRAWASVSADRVPAQRSRDSATLAVPTELPMGALLARAMHQQVRDTPFDFQDAQVDAEVLDGWLPTGTFQAALVEEEQWPVPCHVCRWGSGARGNDGWARVSDVDDLARRADAGDAAAAAELERRLRDEGAVLPLWRPAAVVVSRRVDRVVANSWAPGVLWHAEEWRPVR